MACRGSKCKSFGAPSSYHYALVGLRRLTIRSFRRTRSISGRVYVRIGFYRMSISCSSSISLTFCARKFEMEFVSLTLLSTTTTKVGERTTRRASHDVCILCCSALSCTSHFDTYLLDLLATFHEVHKDLSVKKRKLRAYLTSVIDSRATAKVVTHGESFGYFCPS